MLSAQNLIYPRAPRVEGRAALYSFGFLIRLAVSKRLDIVAVKEDRVGLRVANQSGQIVGQVFLSDSLENGAGYCSHFAQPTELEPLLRLVADGNESLLREILAPHHADACQTSCPDCLRDYRILRGIAFSIGGSRWTLPASRSTANTPVQDSRHPIGKH